MSKFLQDAASVPGVARQIGDHCPLCGSAVTYRGLTAIECEGGRPACPNYKASDLKTVPSGFEYGTLGWARTQHSCGKKVGWDWFNCPPQDRRFIRANPWSEPFNKSPETVWQILD